MRILLLIFIVVPVIEMVILIEVGSRIGAFPTVGLVLLTAVVGVWLLKLQGLLTLSRVQAKLARGELPDTELLEGVMLLIGGTLLLTPGFVTDTIGFICLVPGLRQPIARWILARGVINTIWARSAAQAGQEPQGPGQIRTTIEGEFTDEDKREK